MSLTYDETKKPIAVDTSCDKIIFYEDNTDDYSTGDYNSKAIGEFEIIPNIDVCFCVIYICGKMGCGKSYWAANYAKQYNKINRNNKVYVFSQKDKDPAFDDMKVRRIKFDDEFKETEFDIVKRTEFHNSCIIFDDFSVIPNKQIITKILEALTQLITLGRQYHCHILITSHKFYGYNNRELYSSIQTECTSIVLFKGANIFQLKRILTEYWGLEIKEVKKIMRIEQKSRYKLINRDPQYTLTSEEISLF